MKYDVAIIGGGAAGLFSAVCLKKKRPNLNVVIVEALDRVGKKLLVTGNGRCNITSYQLFYSAYNGSSTEFIWSVFDKFTVMDTVKMFRSIGVEIGFDNKLRGYPTSFQASSVVDALRFFCDETGVVIKTNCAVCDIIQNNGYVLKTNSETVCAETVIVTGGLLAGGKPLGCTGEVLSIVKRLGIKCAPLFPAIVQIKTNTELTRQLKGIKIDATAKLKHGDTVKRSEYGEVLFTDYGLSGPPILQISRNALPGTKIVLDLVNKTKHEELVKILTYRKHAICNRTLENYLTGFINKRLGQVILKDCGFKLSESVKSLSDHDIELIAKKLKCLEFSVVGNTGFNNAQVCCGGVMQSELYTNLGSKKYKGMFFAGEIINVDADCGGFNLQWAWSSAAVASDGVLKCLS